MDLLQRATPFSALHSLVMAALMLASTGLAFGQTTPSKNPTPKPEAVRPEGEGRVFESPEGGFRIWLPKDFRDPVKQNRVLAKEKESFQAFLCLSDRGSITISPFSPPDGLSATPKILKQAAQADLDFQKLNPERERILDREGESGIEIYAKGRFGEFTRFARVQIVAANHLWFEVCFLSPKADFRDDPDIASVFESFEILPKGMSKGPSTEKPKSRVYDSPDGVFRLELPAGFQQPIDQTGLFAESLEGMKGRQYLASGPTGLLMMTRFYQIKGLNTKAEIAEARDGMTAGIIDSMKGKILSSKSVIREGLSWRELRFTGVISGQVFNGRGRILGQKGEIHLFLYLSPSFEILDSEETDRFFDSIKLNP